MKTNRVLTIGCLDRVHRSLIGFLHMNRMVFLRFKNDKYSSSRGAIMVEKRMYFFISMCLSLCVSESERGRERERSEDLTRERERERCVCVRERERDLTR